MAVRYITVMETFLPIALIVVMATVLIVVLAGIITMAVGGDFNKRFGNRLMRARVALQLVAVVVFVILVLSIRAGSG